MTIISAGRMDQRITIQQLTVVRGALGGHDETWSNLAIVWAQTIDQSGGEIYQAMAMGSKTDVVMFLRYRSDVTNKMRVQTADGTILRIANVRKVTRKEFMVLECVKIDG